MADLADFGLVPHHSKTVSPGDKFDRLTIIAIGKPAGTYRYSAVCSCECGTEHVVVRLDQMVRGIARSCGCLQRERTTTHGCWGHRLFARWRNMMDRCYDPKNKRWKDYGGRGITVCERWRDPNDFIADMDGSFDHGLELDRVDNDKGYGPDNCRWATHAEQAGNKRTVRRITHDGRTMNIAEWARETGIPRGTILYRVKRLGWSPEKAVSTPSIPARERMALATKARWDKARRA